MQWQMEVHSAKASRGIFPHAAERKIAAVGRRRYGRPDDAERAPSTRVSVYSRFGRLQGFGRPNGAIRCFNSRHVFRAPGSVPGRSTAIEDKARARGSSCSRPFPTACYVWPLPGDIYCEIAQTSPWTIAGAGDARAARRRPRNRPQRGRFAHSDSGTLTTRSSKYSGGKTYEYGIPRRFYAESASARFRRALLPGTRTRRTPPRHYPAARGACPGNGRWPDGIFFKPLPRAGCRPDMPAPIKQEARRTPSRNSSTGPFFSPAVFGGEMAGRGERPRVTPWRAEPGALGRLGTRLAGGLKTVFIRGR